MYTKRCYVLLIVLFFYIAGRDRIDRQTGYSCQWKQRRPGVQTFVQCNVSL